MKNTKLIVILSTILVLVVAGSAGYFWYNDRSLSNPPQESTSTFFPDNPKKGDLGYKEEKQTTLSAGQSGVYKGSFGRIEGTSLYFTPEGQRATMKFSLNPDEIAIQCSQEDIQNVNQYDLHKIAQVKVANYVRLYNTFKTGTPVFLLTRPEGGTEIVDTIVVPNSDCPADIK